MTRTSHPIHRSRIRQAGRVINAAAPNGGDVPLNDIDGLMLVTSEGFRASERLPRRRVVPGPIIPGLASSPKSRSFACKVVFDVSRAVCPT